MSSDIDPYTHLKITINPDGTITRFIKFPTMKENPNPSHGDPVVSKDHTLNAEKNTYIRVFMSTTLPSNGNTRLPIVIYFSFSGWVQFQTDNFIAHLHCSKLACQVPSIFITVHYCLAPENRLPEQYNDAMDAILWLKKQALDPNGDQWIKEYGDFSRCYLYGCGSGGNIAFFAAIEAVEMELKPLRIEGIIMNQPMLGGKQRTMSELENAFDQILPLYATDLMWELTLPEGADRDHRFCNPMVEGPHTRAIHKLGRCLVIGFCGDPMIDRQQQLVTMLVEHRVQVEARFEDMGFHLIQIVDCEWAIAIDDMVKDFILGERP